MTRKHKLVFFAINFLLLASSQCLTAQTSIDDKIKAIMAKMTLEDKVGEMTQLAINTLSVGEGYNLKEPHELDAAKLRQVLVDLKVGSILNVGNHAYTREHWHEIIKAIQDLAMNEKSTGIPVLYGIDAIHGNNYTVGSTLFPQQITMAASWNPELAERVSAITAYETRASWIPWNFAPVLDIGRDARWPRFWETFGEDVLLASDLGEAYIRGAQGDDASAPDKVAECLKHFLGYSAPMTGKDRTRALIPERQLREYYLPTFQRAIDAGALTIMINSGEVNGIPVHCNKAILTDLLRNELGFKGLAVSDWEDVAFLQTRHRVATDYKDAIRLAVNAGMDMAMVPLDVRYPVLLKELVEEGKVPMSRIDESVERILWVKLQLDLFEHPYYEDYDYSKFASEEHAAVSLEAALESITLLKNEKNTLPLSKSSKVLVTGPTANSMMCMNGGWNRTWQGNDPNWDLEEDKKTILEAIQDEIGKDKVTYLAGASFDKPEKLDEVQNAAAKVDAAIVCLGEMPYTETPGDISDLHLPEAQQQLVEAVAKAGKPIIIVLVEGRPRLISRFEHQAHAILDAYLPGNEGGRAIADLLFGDANPSGKLPFTYPRDANALIAYDHRGTDIVGPVGFNPQYEFGHGLSYTTFSYSDLTLSQNVMNANAPLEVKVTVKNTGKVAGKEVVQVYVTDKVASITPSVKRLRAYQKISLQPGESKEVGFTIAASDLAFVGIDQQWVTEPGEFDIQVGGLQDSFTFE